MDAGIQRCSMAPTMFTVLLYVLVLLVPLRVHGARIDRPFSFSRPRLHYNSIDAHNGQFGRGRRALANSNGQASVEEEEDLFVNVPECTGLLSILREAPATLDLMGNFTEEPNLDLLLECTEKHSRWILQGEQLSQVIFWVFFLGC